jgi:carboxylesterase type B
MVWIYGGGFYSGSASLPLYDGSLLSLKGDVIVVSMQYRVGPLGFLSLDDEHIPGNYGLLDQQMALQWVQNHIAAFGGDASYVTLFGESAGGASVSFHLLSPGSEQLFRNAIMESTTANAPSIFFSKDEAQTNAFALAKLVNCSSTRRTTIKNVADCLRQKTTASALTTEQFKIPFSGPSFRPRFGPTVDGTFLTKSPMELLNAGHFQQKNILLGVNSDEAGFFVLSAFPDYFSTSDDSAPELTPAKYRTAISAMIPLNTSQISAVAFEYSTPCQFADRQSLSNFQALVDLVGDREFKCPVVEVALAYAQESLDSGNDFSVYVYTFEHRDPLDPWPQWAGRALHGDEISFVFGQPFNRVTSANYTDSERQLSDKIITFWTNFAKSGDPNKNNNTGSVTPDNWPKYTADERLVMTFDIGNLQTQAGLRDRQCDFWNVLIPELSATTGHGVRLAGTQSLITTFVMVVCVSLRLISV